MIPGQSHISHSSGTRIGGVGGQAGRVTPYPSARSRQVVCNAREAEPCEKLARSIVGLMLLGTPHKVHAPQALKAEMIQLAKSHRSSKSRLSDTIPDTNALEQLHDRFEEAMLHLSFQILSIYPSSIKQAKSLALTLGSSSQRAQASAGLDFQIGARETSLPTSTSLLNLCQLPLSPGQVVQVHQWVTHLISKLRYTSTDQNYDQQLTPDGQVARTELRVDRSIRSSLSNASFMSPESNRATQGTSIGLDFVQIPAINDTTSRVSGPKLPCF
ncbi:hypothetical protein F4859DRAFT_25273 [Xylaria cf. heliscus]|nr:hypothetical protein F4859DRAFT_25273 [Xylaria cf. heliscus]